MAIDGYIIKMDYLDVSLPPELKDDLQLTDNLEDAVGPMCSMLSQHNWIPLSLVMFSSDCARFSQKVSFIITSLGAFGSCFLQHFSLCGQFWQFSQRNHALVIGTPFFTSVETFLQYSFRPWAQIKQSSSLLYCIFSIRPIWDLYFFVFCAS